MKLTKKSFTQLDIISSTIYALVGLLVISRGPIYLPDSYTFVDMALNHSPAYCTFLKIFTSVFGDYFEWPVVITQYAIIVFGIHVLLKTLNQVFNLHKLGLIIIQLICLAPCVYVHTILTSFTEKVYNKIVFGHFINNTMNYVHIIASPFYIANETDIDLFTNQDERDYFNLVYRSLQEANLTRNQNLGVKIGDYKFYENNFPKICNRRIYDLGLDFYEAKGLNYIDRSIALNTLCSKMFGPLLKQNFKVWLSLFAKNFINSFGSSKQLLFFLVLLFYGVVNLIKSDQPLSYC